MKKFIAALIVVAMVVSAFSVALAAKYPCWTPEEYDESNGARSRIVVEAKTGDVISFYLTWKAAEGTETKDLRLYSRQYGGSDFKNEDKNGVQYGSSWYIEGNGINAEPPVVKQYGDWYYFEVVVKGDGESEVFFDHELVPKANISDVYFAGVAINGTALTADQVKGGDKGTGFAKVADVEIDTGATTDPGTTTQPGTTATPKPTGTTTPKTGVVPAAIVAAVAVLGGAIVLKKKEF